MEDLFKKLFFEFRYTFVGLISGIVLIILTLSSIDSFIEKGLNNFNHRLIGYSFLIFLWFIIWVFFKFNLPKNKKNKIGILVAINSENDKQKVRMKIDFIDGMKNTVVKNNLDDLLNISYLQDYKANKVREILSGYNQVKIKQNNRTIIDHKSTKEYKRYVKFQNKTKFHLIIYGQIIERNDIENKYILNLDAIVIHKPLNMNISNNLARDFQKIFPQEISFYEKLEFSCFQSAKENVFLASRYIIGTAALLSGDPFTAYQVHKNLLADLKNTTFENLNTKNIDIKYIESRLIKLLATELVQQSRYYQILKGDNISAKSLLDQAEQIDNHNYDILILRSYYFVVIDGDFIKALESCRIAKNYSNGNGIWLYNMAFLFMAMNNFKEGYSCYKKIKESKFTDELLTINQCIEFNENYFKVNSFHYQSLFILGYLYYFKIDNLPMALEKFELFITLTAGVENYLFLHYKVISYVAEIQRKMNLND